MRLRCVLAFCFRQIQPVGAGGGEQGGGGGGGGQHGGGGRHDMWEGMRGMHKNLIWWFLGKIRDQSDVWESLMKENVQKFLHLSMTIAI